MRADSTIRLSAFNPNAHQSVVGSVEQLEPRSGLISWGDVEAVVSLAVCVAIIAVLFFRS